MSYERRDYAGAAVATKLSTDITAGATSFTIANAAGWPSGTNGKFLVTIGRNTASEEKVFIQSRSGTTLTLASASDRGAEGTSAQAHGAGADIDHVSGSTDADEANYAVNQTVGKVTTKGDLIVATGANTLARQAVGANNTVLVADSAQSNGVKYAQLDGSSLAAGVAGSGLGGANGSALSVNVDNSTVEISSDSVRVKDTGITGAKLNANVVDNSTIELATNQLRVKDAGITAAKLSLGAWTTYTPTWTAVTTNPTLGNGTITGAYFLFGKTYHFRIYLTIGSTTTFGTGAYSFSLGGGVTSVAQEQSVAATAYDNSANNRFGGSAIVGVSSTKVDRVCTATDASIGISPTLPFTWASTDTLSITGTIEVV